MDNEKARQMMDLLIARAPKLRDAGVVYLELDGCKVQLAPPEPKPLPDSKPQPTWSDPLDDPDTFAGGRIPTYPREGRE